MHRFHVLPQGLHWELTKKIDETLEKASLAAKANGRPTAAAAGNI